MPCCGAASACCLLEQFEPGHTRGSSHGDGRIIRLAYSEAIYVQMMLLAYEGWAELAARAGEPMTRQTGGWDCGPSGHPELAQLEHSFRTFDVPYERLSAAESNRRFPHFHLEPGSEALYQPDAGVVFPSQAVLALWRLIRAGGGDAVSGERVVAIEEAGEQVVVRARSGRCWRAARLVVAAGGWAAPLLAETGLTLPLSVTQEQVGYFLPADTLPHDASAMPVFIDYHTPDPFYGLPQLAVPGVKVGWHHTGAEIDPDAPQPLDDEALRTVERWVAERLPHLVPTATHPLRCLYTNSPDYHFILDRHPELPQIIIGSGFSGHGFKFGPVLGTILAALALDEPPPLSLDLFALGRFERTDRPARRTCA